MRWLINLAGVAVIGLIVWWFWQVRAEDPWGQFGIGWMAVQWAIALALFLLFNGWLVRRTHPEVERIMPPEGEIPAAIP